MQLADADIRPYLHADIEAAWSVEGIRPDRQRVANAADQYPKARVNLLPGESDETGGGAASRDVVLPHVYEITGIFQYDPPGSDVTVNERCVEKWNALAALLNAEYPKYHDWRYVERMAWDWDDNPTERTYSVTLTFTLLVVSRVQTI
jgi:hypothetical protein